WLEPPHGGVASGSAAGPVPPEFICLLLVKCLALRAPDMTPKQLQGIARKEGTPVVVIDHDIIRKNYAAFKKHLPKVQGYYAVKANAEPAIVRTLYKAGASFDVASLPEFMLVYENIKHLPAKAQQDFIWDKIIYANPTKPKETLIALDQYKPLVTYDNLAELQ